MLYCGSAVHSSVRIAIGQYLSGLAAAKWASLSGMTLY